MNLKNKENYILINKFFIQNYIMKVLFKIKYKKKILNYQIFRKNKINIFKLI